VLHKKAGIQKKREKKFWPKGDVYWEAVVETGIQIRRKKGEKGW